LAKRVTSQYTKGKGRNPKKLPILKKKWGLGVGERKAGRNGARGKKKSLGENKNLICRREENKTIYSCGKDRSSQRSNKSQVTKVETS